MASGISKERPLCRKALAKLDIVGVSEDGWIVLLADGLRVQLSNGMRIQYRREHPLPPSTRRKHRKRLNKPAPILPTPFDPARPWATAPPRRPYRERRVNPHSHAYYKDIDGYHENDHE